MFEVGKICFSYKETTMIFHPQYRIRFFLIPGVFALVSACAPQNGIQEPDEEPLEEVEAGRSPVEMDAGGEVPEEPESNEDLRSVEVPDWQARYTELYAAYAEEFRRPEVGDAVRVELIDGSQQAGWVHRITDDEIVLNTGEGLSMYQLEDLSEASAMANLRSVYARKQAYDQGSKEFEKWKKANPEAVHALPNQEPTPQPTPQPTSQPEVVSEEPTDSNEFPFRVNANGRVPHVEDYIRQNAAFPDSLVVRTWWPVQPHERGGYQVRVRYTLKSAGNLGTSYEDMIFFMHGNGRIHQRAPVK